jgi:hypothetical protein
MKKVEEVDSSQRLRVQNGVFEFSMMLNFGSQNLPYLSEARWLFFPLSRIGVGQYLAFLFFPQRPQGIATITSNPSLSTPETM